jgi:quinol monooxygenase YgiN
MYVRLFFSAVDPTDSDEVRRIFLEDVKPAFTQLGCDSVELLVKTEPNAGGLLEGVLLSRWTTRDDLDRALASRPVAESLVRVRQLLRLEPVTHTLEVLA